MTRPKSPFSVDMTGPGCFTTEDRPISDNEVYTLYADYKFNHQPTLDHCDVTIRATERIRRLRYYVEKLTIFDCGIKIMIYDNPQNLNIPAVSSLYSNRVCVAHEFLLSFCLLEN